MAKTKTDCKKAATKTATSELTSDQVTSALFDALNQIMLWMPAEERSKAIIVPDPRDTTKNLAIHTGPDGTAILAGPDYDTLLSMLCTDCIAKVQPYAIIYTGLDCNTGQADPETFVGLAGGHDEEEQLVDEFEIEDDDDDIDDEWVAAPKPQRTLN